MRRIPCRELSGVMVASSLSGSRTKELSANKLQWSSKQACRALYGPRRESRLCSVRVDRRCCSSIVPCRQYCKSTDHDKGHPGISVVGTPDPITWVRNKIILALTELYFDLDFTVEFDHGVKQVLVAESSERSDGSSRFL